MILALSRRFATSAVFAAKPLTLLSDHVAKAAIAGNSNVLLDFVQAVAPVVHEHPVITSNVRKVDENIPIGFGHEFKSDIAIEYNAGGSAAILNIMPPAGEPPTQPATALVEVQRRNENYLPARSLAHVSGCYISSLRNIAQALKQHGKEEKAGAGDTAKKPAAGAAAAAAPPRSRAPRSKYMSAMYNALVQAMPVHMLMFCDFVYALDDVSGVWRAAASMPAACARSQKKSPYALHAPLFSTHRIVMTSPLVLVEGSAPPRSAASKHTSFSAELSRLSSITLVHLPLVPADLDDDDAWARVAPSPAHAEALDPKSRLRFWLHHLAHTHVSGTRVQLAPVLQADLIFRESAAAAESALGREKGQYSEKEMAEADAAIAEAEAAAEASAKTAAEEKSARIALERKLAVVEASAAKEKSALERRVAASAEEKSALERRVAASAEEKSALERRVAAFEASAAAPRA